MHDPNETHRQSPTAMRGPSPDSGNLSLNTTHNDISRRF